MQNKRNIFTFLFVLIIHNACCQTEWTVNLDLGKEVTKTDSFKFSILTQQDTIPLFIGSKPATSIVGLSMDEDSLTGLFEYREVDGNWQSVKYTFDWDTLNLKRIVVDLYFSIDDSKVEFLQSFKVSKYYYTNSVSIYGEGYKVGSHPVFILTNHSDSTFYGVSSSSHFYGTIKTKTAYGWISYSGSYCTSTHPESPLADSDTAYSWVPFYNIEEKYSIEKPGIYRYVVPLILKKHYDTSLRERVGDGGTRRRTQIFFELEMEFEVE